MLLGGITRLSVYTPQFAIYPYNHAVGVMSFCLSHSQLNYFPEAHIITSLFSCSLHVVEFKLQL